MNTVITNQDTLISKLEALLAKYPVILQLFRFVAIGVLNYSLDTIIFNFISKLAGVQAGSSLGIVNVPGFIAAVIQSYLWNHYWTFSSSQAAGLVKNFIRLFLVGGMGFLAMVLVLIGAKASAQPSFYLIILVTFAIAEIVLWNGFGLRKGGQAAFSHREFLIFILVSVIGLLINSLLLAVLSARLDSSAHGQISSDLIKNLAKILATVASLIWNFIGYKLFVFKR
jgi:putative flippase GtrA